MKGINVFLFVLCAAVLMAVFPANIFAQNNVPKWLSNPPVEPGTAYGIGQAKLADSKIASMLAEERAILSAVYGPVYQALYYLNQASQDSPSIDFVKEKETRSVTLTWDISDIEIVEREQTSDGTWWCLVIYKYKKKPY
jgi:hypothetical protein